jgi:hypothetical protein
MFLFACAHAPSTKTPEDPKVSLLTACEIGAKTQEVKGSAWLKAKSKDASGQFPAAVLVNSANSSLKMEVTNLVGATEAVITVNGRHYVIDVPGKKSRKQEGHGSWAGIPLRWATELFLGRFPCLSTVALKDAVISADDKGSISVETKANLESGKEKFVYKMKEWAGKSWIEELHWEALGTFAAKVDFKFSDPEDSDGSPRKWEAKSDQGEIKVRWKDRESKQ